MNPSPCLRWLAALALAAGPAATPAASPATPHAANDPTQAQASVPAVQHRSVFTRYRPLADLKPVPWREANETVNRIGGWRAYAREAAAPEPPASAPEGTAARPGSTAAQPPLAPQPRTPEHRHGR